MILFYKLILDCLMIYVLDEWWLISIWLTLWFLWWSILWYCKYWVYHQTDWYTMFHSELLLIQYKYFHIEWHIDYLIVYSSIDICDTLDCVDDNYYIYYQYMLCLDIIRDIPTNHNQYYIVILMDTFHNTMHSSNMN